MDFTKIVQYSDQQMHNIYIYNNISYNESTATCCNASASFSGCLNLVVC